MNQMSDQEFRKELELASKLQLVDIRSINEVPSSWRNPEVLIPQHPVKFRAAEESYEYYGRKANCAEDYIAMRWRGANNWADASPIKISEAQKTYKILPEARKVELGIETEDKLFVKAVPTRVVQVPEGVVATIYTREQSEEIIPGGSNFGIAFDSEGAPYKFDVIKNTSAGIELPPAYEFEKIRALSPLELEMKVVREALCEKIMKYLEIPPTNYYKCDDIKTYKPLWKEWFTNETNLSIEPGPDNTFKLNIDYPKYSRSLPPFNFLNIEYPNLHRYDLYDHYGNASLPKAINSELLRLGLCKPEDIKLQTVSFRGGSEWVFGGSISAVLKRDPELLEGIQNFDFGAAAEDVKIEEQTSQVSQDLGFAMAVQGVKIAELKDQLSGEKKAALREHFIELAIREINFAMSSTPEEVKNHSYSFGDDDDYR